MNMSELITQLNQIHHDKTLEQYKYLTPEKVHIKERKKFTAIDIGDSGAWLIEKATGEIFNIKGYGVADYNKKKRSDIGSLATVNPLDMYNKRWNYLR